MFLTAGKAKNEKQIIYSFSNKLHQTMATNEKERTSNIVIIAQNFKKMD